MAQPRSVLVRGPAIMFDLRPSGHSSGKTLLYRQQLLTHLRLSEFTSKPTFLSAERVELADKEEVQRTKSRDCPSQPKRALREAKN